MRNESPSALAKGFVVAHQLEDHVLHHVIHLWCREPEPVAEMRFHPATKVALRRYGFGKLQPGPGCPGFGIHR